MTDSGEPHTLDQINGLEHLLRIADEQHPRGARHHEAVMARTRGFAGTEPLHRIPPPPGWLAPAPVTGDQFGQLLTEVAERAADDCRAKARARRGAWLGPVRRLLAFRVLAREACRAT